MSNVYAHLAAIGGNSVARLDTFIARSEGGRAGLARLVQSHGARGVAHVFAYDVFSSVGELDAALQRRAGRVRRPVRSLYHATEALAVPWLHMDEGDSFKSKFKLRGLTERAEQGGRTITASGYLTSQLVDGSRYVESKLSAPGRVGALFDSSYAPASDTIAVHSSFLHDIPGWISKRAVSLLRGGLTPTAVHVVMRQMRELGVAYGEAAAFEVSGVSNIGALVHSAWLRREHPAIGESSLARFFVQEYYGYLRTALEQSGHRVISYSKSQGHEGSIGRLMVAREEERGSAVKNVRGKAAGRQARRQMKARHAALLARYGLSASDKMFTNFNLYGALEPLASPR